MKCIPKVIEYKKLEDIQKEYSTDITAPVVVPAVIKGIYLDWDPMGQQPEFYVPVSYKQHAIQTESVKPKKKTINNIFGACLSMTKIGAIVTLLIRLIGSFEQTETHTPIHQMKKLGCRLVFAPVGTELKMIAIGHPTKDYFLYLEDFHNARPGDIIPDTVAHMGED